VKQQEGRIKHLEKELKAAREEICELKAVTSWSRIIQENWGGETKKIPTLGPIASLQMMLFKVN
jgi:hypothetical protein